MKAMIPRLYNILVLYVLSSNSCQKIHNQLTPYDNYYPGINYHDHGNYIPHGNHDIDGKHGKSKIHYHHSHHYRRDTHDHHVYQHDSNSSRIKKDFSGKFCK